MRRRTFDVLVSTGGRADRGGAGGGRGAADLGYSSTNDQVSSQLSAQKIVFPAAGSPEIKELPAADAAAMKQYAGQLMTTGAQAQTYANHFIAVHLRKIGGGKTYAQLSAESLAQPKNTALAAQVETVFKGTALRSMLLDAYAFWQIGQIALIAAIVAFCAALVFLVLAVLGFWQLRRTPAAVELLAGAGQRA